MHALAEIAEALLGGACAAGAIIAIAWRWRRWIEERLRARLFSWLEQILWQSSMAREVSTLQDQVAKIAEAPQLGEIIDQLDRIEQRLAPGTEAAPRT